MIVSESTIWLPVPNEYCFIMRSLIERCISKIFICVLWARYLFLFFVSRVFFFYRFEIICLLCSLLFRFVCTWEFFPSFPIEGGLHGFHDKFLLVWISCYLFHLVGNHGIKCDSCSHQILIYFNLRGALVLEIFKRDLFITNLKRLSDFPLISLGLKLLILMF